MTETSGPWGTLQAYPVFIAAPDAILDHLLLPSAVTVWTFRGLSPDAVAEVLRQPGLPPQVAGEILDRGRWQVIGDEIRVLPSDAALHALPPDARAKIYDTLARWDENEFQCSPYFVPAGDVRAWLADADLPPPFVETIARTAYPVGDATCFSDLPLLISMTSSQAEARRLLKILSRTETVLLRVRLQGPDDAAKVRDYWGAGTANCKDFVPLLESVAANPDVDFLDVVHLLPPLPRKLLYTFPQPSMGIGGRYPDCHWTSLNFFRERPEPRLADAVGATMFTVESLQQAPPPYAYGDALLMMDAKGEAIHSCVYLADGYVFTKNGANVLSPWLIMKLDEVLHRYSRRGPVEVKIYRK